MRMLLAGTVLAAMCLAGCSEDGETAEEAADRLAASLEARHPDPRLFGGDTAQPSYDEVTDELDDASVQVDVKSVAEDEGRAEVTLAWSWTVEGAEWRYESTAELEESDGGWRTAWDPAIVEPSLQDGERLGYRRLAATRGDVLGAGGTRLVTERPVVRFGIDKTKVPAARAADSARRAARLLGVSVSPYVQAVRAAGDQAFVEAIVLRPEDARTVDPAYSGIRGAVALDATMPLAPTREFAGPILGRVGPVTAELVQDSGGRLQAGDVAGLSGLQARYDVELAGTAGVELLAVAADGTSRSLLTVDPVDGKPLRTTLDLRLQRKAEAILDRAGTDAPVSALVAVRPSTGALLVAANGAGNDGLNAATYGQYAPGSTFKVVSSLALLRSGMTPESRVSCPPTVVVDGKAFKNYADYPSDALGAITLRQAVAHSCNTAFIGARTRIDADSLGRAAESLGLGVDHDLGFPAYFGQVPPAGSETEAAADMIGQGKILASPMAMAAVAASVQAGTTVVPHLLEGQGSQAEAEPAAPLTGSEAAALRELMRAVVTGGSGSFLAGLPGAVGAKTGTAEYGEPGAGGTLPTHAWMIATRDDLAVAVFVETGESGSSTAGPLLEAFLS